MHGMVIAGTHSGCGKTTVTLGLLCALKKKGLKIQSFKVGPDFIDTGLHTFVTGIPSRNLDLWMCGEQGIKECFSKHTADVDIAVVEGVMGMYDGDFNTADLAVLLNLPVVLVVDAYGMAESAGAIVSGFAEYSRVKTVELKKTAIAGVIFNRVSSEMHFNMLKHAVRDVPVLGYLPKNDDFKIHERHLGLIPAQENPITQQNIDKLGETVLEYIDIDGIIQASVVGAGLSRHYSSHKIHQIKDRGVESLLPQFESPNASIEPKIRIALAYDKAFCFYYADNLDLLRDAGAEIIRFSPMVDEQVPDADVLYIGGGYPEVHAHTLSENKSMFESIRAWVDADKPVYAECGGMMYLSKGIYDFDNRFHRMVDVMPFETKMERSRLHLGYREIILKEDCILGKKDDRLKGQEFHYSERINITPGVLISTCYKLEPNHTEEGYCVKCILASYIHVHFYSNPNIALQFINFIKRRI
ncbi:MAG: cobyrinate a,c-diamide synthase [Deltaproteobacteria bacterium]|nr:cobyrinate a,c-diamide synthase [Deltaproteobacteria bacterium]MCL5793084.1 cobyrinate a,c-diamide synthase [Deltaproteobacteria bacterium]